MNPNPDISGITKRWVDGEDDRKALLLETMMSEWRVDRFLDGLWRLLSSRRRTKFVGFGVFEWKPWRRRLPTGKMAETWRLVFKPSRYARRYHGDT